MVHAHGLPVRVCVGDHGGDAVERSHGVQPLGQQPEPLLRHRVLAQEVFSAVLNPPSGDDALPRGEVPALRARPQDAQMVRDGVHEAPLGELAKPLSQRGGGDAPEAG